MECFKCHKKFETMNGRVILCPECRKEVKPWETHRTCIVCGRELEKGEGGLSSACDSCADEWIEKAGYTAGTKHLNKKVLMEAIGEREAEAGFYKDLLRGENVETARARHGLPLSQSRRLLNQVRGDSYVKNGMADKSEKHGNKDGANECFGWPDNILSDVFGINGYEELESGLTRAEICENLEKVLLTLSEREQKVIKLRYKEDMHLEETGAVMGVSRERVRQIEAKGLRKLRHPDRKKAILETEEMARLRKELEEASKKRRLEVLEETVKAEEEECIRALKAESEERIKAIKAGNIPGKVRARVEYGDDDLYLLELSTRSYNCLKRAGINTISALLDALYDEEKDAYDAGRIANVRNIGRKSLDEIAKIVEGRTGKEVIAYSGPQAPKKTA